MPSQMPPSNVTMTIKIAMRKGIARTRWQTLSAADRLPLCERFRLSELRPCNS